jgi:AcrR family transcriptional regulator
MSTTGRSSERLEQVLQVAGQLFARHGYHATSTREIARIARISENTLFRQFENKEQLFWEALRHRFASFKLPRELLEAIANSRGPEIVLPQLLAQLADTATLNPDSFRLLAVAFLEFRWEAGNTCADFLGPIFSTVKTYLKKNMDAGMLRSLDPAVLTAALGVTVISYPEIARTLDGSSQYRENRDAVESFSKLWLSFLLPEGNASWNRAFPTPAAPAAI